MNVTRRQALGLLAGAGAGAAVVAGCAPDDRPIAKPTLDTDPDARFLARAGFGPKPGDVEKLRSVGRE
ncbi:MAG TPA: hypothetical protein VNI20_00195, partial [Fimbriimonadaceae bacterium]|nr:hypothetical protein [Fimbriimonadaceae bacterium]